MLKLTSLRFDWNRVVTVVYVSLAIAASLLVVDCWSSASRAAVFDEIQLDMSRDEVNKVLISHKMSCVGDMQRQYRNCEFKDFWRLYKISFDQAERVNYKTYLFNAPEPIEKHLIDAIR